MADKVLKVIAENKIKELEVKVEELKSELRSEESFNSAAWAEYGSELCAGEMMNKELKIRIEIGQVSNKIVLLRKFIAGEIDTSREEELRRNSMEAGNRIQALLDSRGLIDGEIAEIEALKGLLAITF